MKYKFKPSHIVPASLFVVAVLYGGSKPPMPTNAPPDGVSSPTNAPMMMCFSPRPMMSPPPEPTNQVTDQPTNQIANWSARGAWSDWQRVEFRGGFAFPVGTNLVDAVTLFARGELRSKVEVEGRGLQWNCLASLPDSVSLEPGVSEVRHGLTPSNSYLFAWHDCCVDRERTNRVDASIELFRSGAIAVRTSSAVQPPTFDLIPPSLPEGFSGVGQGEDWVRATFADNADGILAKGYDNWLRDDWVGTNEMNGCYQCAVTVPALPEDGEPCYLVCGPYRVNVTAPGTYRFPLEVLTTYEIRTYPTAVPLTFEYDDGYTGEDPSFYVVDGRNPPHASPPPMLLMASSPSCDYWKTLVPCIIVSPKIIPFSAVPGTHLKFWCNVRDFVLAAIETAAYLTWYEVSFNEVALERAYEAGLYYACAHEDDWMLSGEFSILQHIQPDDDGPVTNRTDAWIFSGERIHTEIVATNRLVRHVTAVTGTNSTTSLSIRLAEGQSAYVAVYMASTEPYATPPYDDTVSWSITSNNGGSLSGSTSVFANSEGLAGQLDFERYVYGIDFDPLFLGGQRFAPPADGSLRLQISVSASDAIDDLRDTCVQAVVYPIDEDGNVIGLPSWVSD